MKGYWNYNLITNQIDLFQIMTFLTYCYFINIWIIFGSNVEAVKKEPAKGQLWSLIVRIAMSRVFNFWVVRIVFYFNLKIYVIFPDCNGAMYLSWQNAFAFFVFLQVSCRPERFQMKSNFLTGQIYAQIECNEPAWRFEEKHFLSTKPSSWNWFWNSEYWLYSLLICSIFT